MGEATHFTSPMTATPRVAPETRAAGWFALGATLGGHGHRDDSQQVAALLTELAGGPGAVF